MRSTSCWKTYAITFWFTRLNFADCAECADTAAQYRGSRRADLAVHQHRACALADDEAFVVTANGAEAAYRHFVVNDWWYRSIDPWRRQSSLNNAQMVANEDGTFTYVVAIQDPGVHNWIDTGGLHVTYAIQKWQGLPRDMQSERAPRITGLLVKLKDLPNVLPRGTRWLTPDERKKQLAQRAAAYERRIIGSATG